MVKLAHKSMIRSWRKSPLIDKFARLSRFLLLILNSRYAYQSIKALIYHLSRIDELPPNQFFENIIKWSGDLTAWHRRTIERMREEAIILEYQPKITIITSIFGFEGGLIRRTLESIERQYYQEWELYLLVEKNHELQLLRLTTEIFNGGQKINIKCNSDLDGNLVEALNEVLRECKGECIAFLSGSDRLTSNALFEVARSINQYPDTDIIYSDEAEKDKDTLIRLFYKPGWSRDLFLSMHYLRNLLCCRSEVIRAVGGFQGNFEDDIKYNMILRMIEKRERVHHIPRILYHEQVPKNAYPQGFTANHSFMLHKKALHDHMKRVGIKGEVCDGIFEGSFRVRRKVLKRPKVSIIIPTKDKADQLKRCIESIESKTTYRNFEVIIVDNASTELKSLEYLKTSPCKVIQYAQKFNFSKINNLAAHHATGEYLFLLNDDTQVISPDWLEAMLEHAQREEVGVVGAKLLYPNGLTQHAGVVLEGNCARHIHRFISLSEHGYYGMADVVRNFNVVTGACLMIRKSVFEEVGGFEESLDIIYNDVDLCLKVRSRGYLIVYTPYAVLYHYEGISRRVDLGKEAEAMKFLYSRWNTFMDRDIYFNPNCCLTIPSLFCVSPYGNYYNVFEI